MTMAQRLDLDRLTETARISQGALLRLAREVAHDGALASIDHLTLDQGRELLFQVWQISVGVREMALV